jgi:hypothetical protein
MTEQLKTLMHAQADSVDFAAPDLDAMVRTGDRRVRHRRLGAAVGVVALVVGIALVVPAVNPGERAVQPAGPTASGAPLSWVDGSTLHEDDRAYALDFRPRAYVRTAEGYVFSDRDGNVWSWVDGATTLVGETNGRSPRLVSDEESGLAGWVTLDGPEYVVVDQATGTITGHPAPAGTDYDDFAALDAGRAYWRGTDGPVVVDLRTGDETPVPSGRDTYLGDFEDDLVTVSGDQGTVIETVDGTPVLEPTDSYSDLGYLSPGARYYAWDADDPQVYDVRSGERVAVDIGSREFASGYEWLGDRTLALIASTELTDDARVQLLRCEVPGGPCTTVATLGSFDDMADRLVLPVGIPIE